VDIAKVVNRTEDFVDAAKVAEKAEDLNNAANVTKKIEDRKTLQNVPEELGDVIFKVKRIKKILSKPFKFNPKHDFDEFVRQLKGQEDGLKKLTVDDFIKNRDKYLKNGRSNSASKAQKDFRDKARNKRIKDNRKKGMSYEEAKVEANQWMDTQAALHDPDQVAGGFGDNVTGMGDKRVNSGLESQWKDRIDEIDRQVREAAEKMTEAEKKSTYLDIELLIK
jgi:NTP pyrophosphatase (non-canonical NTP hydrolase)